MPITTQSPPPPPFCRKTPDLSLQPLSKVRKIFAHLPKLPYLCIVEQNKQRLSDARTENITIKIYKIMTQKNEMSVRALAMEELENVNGGKVTVKRVGDRLICC